MLEYFQWSIILNMHRLLKNDRLCYFLWWILKTLWFSYKNRISWSYVGSAIFFAFKDMDLIFYSGESWKSILCNSNHFKCPRDKRDAVHYIGSWRFFLNVFFKKMWKGAFWGALRILKPRWYQKINEKSALFWYGFNISWLQSAPLLFCC